MIKLIVNFIWLLIKKNRKNKLSICNIDSYKIIIVQNDENKKETYTSNKLISYFNNYLYILTLKFNKALYNKLLVNQIVYINI